jgi:glycosyltransferase involved in cell wall biosynthesis
LHGVVAIIPAFNEEDNIAQVVKAITPKYPVIVIDDGSSDGTFREAQVAGATVVSHPRNLGYDAALHTGILHAISCEFEFAVTLDADGQHNPALVDHFQAELQKGYQLIVGKREIIPRWSEYLFSLVATSLWGLEDPLCGMKGYHLQSLRRLSTLKSFDSVGTEIAIRLVKSGVQALNVNVTTRPRIGVSRFGSSIRANIKICRALINSIRFCSAAN